jgi:hypothetical protein
MPNEWPPVRGGDARSSPPGAGRPLPGAHVPGAAGTAWPRLLLGLALVYSLFRGAATALGSDRGQAGLLVGALVVAATLCVERLLFGEPPGRAARALGLGRPLARGLLAAAGVCLALLLVFPAFAAVTGRELGLYAGWTWLLAALLSAPLAYLFELGGGTVWAPALVHAVMQGAIKVITVEGTDALFPLVWMAAGALLPNLVFLVPRPRESQAVA